MTIPEIASRETVNTNRVYLYKEGSFWKAYEFSAYLFITHVKTYQTKIKFYQNVGMQIVSIGFPDIALPQLLENRNVMFQTDREVVIQIEIPETPAKETFTEWKIQRLPLAEPKPQPAQSPVVSSAEMQVSIFSTDDMQAVQLDQSFVGANDDLFQPPEIFQTIRDFPLATSTPLDCMNFVAELKKMTPC
jgi:hypothetical protein